MRFNQKILVVDDNKDVHSEFRSLLQPVTVNSQVVGDEYDGDSLVRSKASKYELICAAQGWEAIEIVKQAEVSESPFALAFIDLRMPPGINGLETIKKIWEISPLMEVVLCTSYSDHNLNEISEFLGDTKRLLLLKKPFEPFEIKQISASLTAKWNYAYKVNFHLSNLETLLNERTTSLDQERALRIQASKMAALGEMAGGIAHEINNPLAIIYGSADRLMKIVKQDPPDTDKIHKITSKILTTSERISRIIQSMLAISHSDHVKSLQNVPLKSMLFNCLDLCHEKFKSNGIRVELADLSGKETIECNYTQIVQVFINLLNNAHDAIVDLDQKDKWIKVEIMDCENSYKILFMDSGPGVPSSIIDKIWEPFFTTKAVGKGTGLGLSLVGSFVSDHQGELSLDHECGNTCFVVRLYKKIPK